MEIWRCLGGAGGCPPRDFSSASSTYKVFLSLSCRLRVVAVAGSPAGVENRRFWSRMWRASISEPARYMWTCPGRHELGVAGGRARKRPTVRAWPSGAVSGRRRPSIAIQSGGCVEDILVRRVDRCAPPPPLFAHTRLRHVKEYIAQAVGAPVRSLNHQNRDQIVPRIDPALGSECAAVAIRSFGMPG